MTLFLLGPYWPESSQGAADVQVPRDRVVPPPRS
jgi:hypothetical protein